MPVLEAAKYNANAPRFSAMNLPMCQFPQFGWAFIDSVVQVCSEKTWSKSSLHLLRTEQISWPPPWRLLMLP